MIAGIMDALMREATMAAVESSFEVIKRFDGTDRERAVAHFGALFSAFSLALATYVELLPEADRLSFIALTGLSLYKATRNEVDSETVMEELEA